MTLSSIFQAGRGGKPEDPELEGALERLVADALQAHPQLGLALETFVRHVAERVPADTPPRSTLAGLHAGDLYLACACAAGNARALAVLEQRVLAPLASRLARSAESLADEVLQVLRARVLVSDGGSPPRIAGYDGRGPLSAWLRVSAARITVDLQRAQHAHAPLDVDREAGSLPRTADPELAFLKTHYRKDLADAFRTTIAALPARDANVLRLHYLEQANAQTIAGIYGVSPRAVQYWITQARRRILDETRRTLGDRLRLSDAETDSVMGLAQSQLDITLHTILDKETP